MQEFAGKVAVVTGAGQGIGRELVRRFTDEGMKAVVADGAKEAASARDVATLKEARRVLMLQDARPRLAGLP